MGRGIALGLSLFTLCNIAGAENRWWIDVRPLPDAVLALPALLLILPGRWRPAVLALLLVALANTARYYALPLHAAPALPLSAFVAGLLLLVLFPPPTRRPRLAMALTLGLLGAALPAASPPRRLDPAERAEPGPEGRTPIRHGSTVRWVGPPDPAPRGTAGSP